MTPEETTELKEIRSQVSEMAGDLKALVNETANQSKIKNNLNARLTVIEQNKGASREEYSAVERRLDAVEIQVKIRGKEANIYKAVAYFVLNGILLIFCACVGKFI